MKMYRVFLLFLCVVTVEQVYSGYFDRLTPDPQSWLGRAVAPLQAGHQYSELEKKEARKAIIELDKKRVKILLQLSSSVGLPFLQEELQDIEEKIYEQKLITGQVWSTRRKIVLGALALAGFVALGYGSYRLYQYIYPEEAVYAAFEKVRAIEGRKYTTKEDALKNKHDLAQAYLELENASKKVFYSQPAAVKLDNVPALGDRLWEVVGQQYIPLKKDGFVIVNPSSNPEDLIYAYQEYISALALPKNSHYVSELQKQVDNYQGSYSNLRYLETILNEVKKKVLADARHLSSPVVRTDEVKALRNILEAIYKERYGMKIFQQKNLQ